MSAISGRADRKPAQCRGGDRLRDRGAGRRAGWSCTELRSASVRTEASGKSPSRFLFSFIGAEPNTDWLQSSGIKLDSRGFVLTGDDVGEGRLPLETSRRGVFAVGDVRCCSVKRVAAAVGDGAQVVAAIHAYLAKAPAHGAASAQPVRSPQPFLSALPPAASSPKGARMLLADRCRQHQPRLRAGRRRARSRRAGASRPIRGAPPTNMRCGCTSCSSSKAIRRPTSTR